MSNKLKPKKLLVYTIIAFLFTLPVINKAHAQTEILDKGITVSPIKYVFSGAPGERLGGTLTLYNATFSGKQIYLYKRNFRSDGSSGIPLFFTDPLPYTASLKDWIQLDKDSVYVKKVEKDNPHTEKINFQINIPTNAEPGGYYAGIITTLQDPSKRSETEKGNLAFKSDQGAIILLTVEGAVSKQLSVDNFYTTSPFLAEPKKIKIFEWMPVRFLTRIRNSGNTHNAPLGNITVYKRGKKVEELEYNENEGFILRESTRDFSADWSNSLFQLKPKLNESAEPLKDSKGNIKTKLTVNPENYKRFRLGKYTAKLNVVYDSNGQKESVISSFDFWIFPWKLILLLIVILVILWLIRRYFKERREQKREKSYNTTNLP